MKTTEAKSMDTKDIVSFIKKSCVFDERWYINEYPDVAASGLDPILHYAKYGMRVGRPPCADSNSDKGLTGFATMLQKSSISNKPTLAVLTPNTTFVNNEVKAAPASTHIRILQKTSDSANRKLRYEVTSPQKCLAAIDKYVGIIVQRNALAKNFAEAIIAECRKRKIPIIYEIDDDLIERALMPDPSQEYLHSAQSIKILLKAAKLVIVSTEVLRNRYLAEATEIIVLPNAVNENLWFPAVRSNTSTDNAWKYKRLSKDEKRVVYMGSKTHLDDLLILKEAFKRIKEVHKRVRLFTIGVTDTVEDWFEPIDIPQQLQDYKSFVPWLKEVFSTMDFAVAPLTDTYFNNAKSPLKFLEYSAAKLPTICSNVVPYNQAVKHRITGLLVNNDTSSWTSAMLEAIQSTEFMTTMGLKAHDEVIQNHLMRDHIERFDSAILGILHPTSISSYELNG